MTKAFTKGDEVVHINVYHHTGKATWFRATVHSCGKVRMVLTHAEGERAGQEAGREFLPERGTVGKPTATFLADGRTDEELQALALQCSEQYLKQNVKYWSDVLDNGTSPLEGHTRRMLSEARAKTPDAQNFWAAVAELSA